MDNTAKSIFELRIERLMQATALEPTGEAKTALGVPAEKQPPQEAGDDVPGLLLAQQSGAGRQPAASIPE